MDPSLLIAPQSSLGLPAPYWFMGLLKVMGFTLHTVPMNLWFAGILVAMLARWKGSQQASHWSARFMRQMPLIVALGVNFGIVPLLFLQAGYYRVFYPATILTAWPWLAIIGLLLVAYYGVYIYVGGLREDSPQSYIRKASGWVSAIIFMGIGFLFANGMSLMTNVAAWPKLWESTQVAGAALGTVVNLNDATLIPRWLMMFGLALTTTAAYVTVDAGLFARHQAGSYREWTATFSFKLYSLGLVWFALAGSWYVFGTWIQPVKEAMLQPPLIYLTAVTALSPGTVWLLLFLGSRRGRPTAAWAVALAQLGMLALNALSRQIVQNLELAPYYNPAAEPLNIQWVPMLIFLAVFAVGLGTVGWIFHKVYQVESR
jgi:hypothetical protein